MNQKIYQNLGETVGSTPLLKIGSLSELAGCEILVKCEHLNPGGSIKDRAALQMVKSAIEEGKLKEGMKIIEGTAGNTGIGLAVVGKSLGFEVEVVMPSGQTPEKQKMIELHGAKLHLVPPCPFKDQNHFYHTAKRMAEENPTEYWWADQFENTNNSKAHYLNTGPEIYKQTGGQLDHFVSVAGTGGTIGGNSKYLKEVLPEIKVTLIDPKGSGLFSFFKTGEFKSEGGSFTEGIGIMREVANFRQAEVDEAYSISDEDLVAISRFVQKEEGLVLGSSSALNIAGAFKVALADASKGQRIVTFSCDLGERSFSKLYNQEFLDSKEINPDKLSIDSLISKYRN